MKIIINQGMLRRTFRLIGDNEELKPGTRVYDLNRGAEFQARVVKVKTEINLPPFLRRVFGKER